MESSCADAGDSKIPTATDMTTIDDKTVLATETSFSLRRENSLTP